MSLESAEKSARIYKAIIGICKNQPDLHQNRWNLHQNCWNLLGFGRIWLNLTKYGRDLARSPWIWAWSCWNWSDLYITSIGSVAWVLGKKTRHLTRRRRGLDAETRNWPTEASVRAKIVWGLGGDRTGWSVRRVWVGSGHPYAESRNGFILPLILIQLTHFFNVWFNFITYPLLLAKINSITTWHVYYLWQNVH